MSFGKTTNSMQDLKNKLSGRSDVPFPERLKNGVPKRIRFLTEPDDWSIFTLCWNNDLKTSYPEPQDGHPFCEGEDVQKTERFLCNVLDLSDNTVKALLLSRTLAIMLFTKWEKRNQTITDRDYELSSVGEKQRITYNIESDDPMIRDVSRYQLYDLEAVLENWWRYSLNKYNQSVQNNVNETIAAVTPTVTQTVAPIAIQKQQEETSEETEYTLDELESMSVKELREVAKAFGVSDTMVKKEELVEQVLEAQFEN